MTDDEAIDILINFAGENTIPSAVRCDNIIMLKRFGPLVISDEIAPSSRDWRDDKISIRLHRLLLP